MQGTLFFPMKRMTGDHLEKRIIIYDGVCILCNNFVQWLIKRDQKGAFHFTTLQSDLGQQLITEHQVKGDTVVLWDNGKVYTKSDVALNVLSHLSVIWWIFIPLKLLPSVFRNAVYDWIAKNRYKWFGKYDSCLLPDPSIRERFI